MESNGQHPEFQIRPEEVVPFLLQRIENLAMECALRDARIAQLEQAPRPTPQPAPFPGDVVKQES